VTGQEQDKTGTRQDRNKTRQDKTGTRQDKTRQDKNPQTAKEKETAIDD
jgi:hypothetical protein